MAANTLIKSKQRVADHGEVFTPPHIVEAMIKMVEPEVNRIDSRELEPACGSGNFLVPILKRKLATVDDQYGRSEFERRHYSLLALISVYGIELLADNAGECCQNLLEVFADHLRLPITDDGDDDPLLAAARTVLRLDIVNGDALAMKYVSPPTPIVFSEWAYLGKGDFHRRDFRYDNLTKARDFQTVESIQS